jgi:hypothetical protein
MNRTVHVFGRLIGAESLLMSSVAVLETRIVLFARLGLDEVGVFEDLLESRNLSWCRWTTK